MWPSCSQIEVAMHISKDNGLVLFAFAWFCIQGIVSLSKRALTLSSFSDIVGKSKVYHMDTTICLHLISILFLPLNSWVSKQYVKSILFLEGFSWKSKAILQSLIVVTFKDMKSEGLCNSIQLICCHHINYDSFVTSNEQSMCRKGSQYIIGFVCGAFNTLWMFGFEKFI